MPNKNRREDNEEIAALTGEAIFKAAKKADTAAADALFISCTAIRAVEVIDRLEQALGKPVITANQAMFWQALRVAGCNAKIEGYGALLRKFWSDDKAGSTSTPVISLSVAIYLLIVLSFLRHTWAG